MRVLFVLLVIAVFAALMIFDTTALIRLTAFCVAGGCGVSPVWIAAAVGGFALLVVLGPRLARGKTKPPPARKRAGPRKPKPKQPAAKKPRAAGKKTAKTPPTRAKRKISAPSGQGPVD